MNRIVVSDTSCLIALTKINKLDLLKDLFEEIVITNEVSNEFGGYLSHWIKIVDTKNHKKQHKLEKILDIGEASSIALALENDNTTLIIDERKGRSVAQSLKIDIIGTIGIIVLAKKKGLINDVSGIILRLINNGFRLSDSLLNMLIQKYSNE